MTTDQKIDEVLKIVLKQGDQLVRLIQEQAEESKTRDKDLLGLMTEERGLNNARFTQLATGVSDVRKEVGELRMGLGSLDAKIDKVYDSLSQDIQIFADDLHHVKRRTTRLEKKLLS